MWVALFVCDKVPFLTKSRICRCFRQVTCAEFRRFFATYKAAAIKNGHYARFLFTARC